MPTNAASNATAPRMRSASAASVASASGRLPCGVAHRTSSAGSAARRPASRAAPRRARAPARPATRLRGLRRVALVHAAPPAGRSGLELPREALRRARSSRARRRRRAPAGRPRARRLPFGDQRRDGGEARRVASPAMVVSGCASRVSVSPTATPIAPRAEVEARARWRRRVGATTRHACPTSSDRREKSMPSRRIAAGSRLGGQVEHHVGIGLDGEPARSARSPARAGPPPSRRSPATRRRPSGPRRGRPPRGCPWTW